MAEIAMGAVGERDAVLCFKALGMRVAPTETPEETARALFSFTREGVRVIFITENDVLKAGLPIYHVDRTVRETGTFFNDQAHIVYVNSQIKDETALGKLMHDFFCTNSKDMNYSILAQRVRYFKEDTKGVAAMCRAMEKMRDETEHETSVKHALAMLADGVPCEKVAKYTDLSIEEVRALAEKKSA